MSIKEEKVEYVGANNAESFVLFDASNQGKSDLDLEKPSVENNSGVSHLPVV